jgi:hypothetical protein
VRIALVLYFCQYIYCGDEPESHVKLSWILSDFKVEHDSRGLCDGVDSSQQELYQRGQDNCDCCGYWCWCLHYHKM